MEGINNHSSPSLPATQTSNFIEEKKPIDTNSTTISNNTSKFEHSYRRRAHVNRTMTDSAPFVEKYSQAQHSIMDVHSPMEIETSNSVVVTNEGLIGWLMWKKYSVYRDIKEELEWQKEAIKADLLFAKPSLSGELPNLVDELCTTISSEFHTGSASPSSMVVISKMQHLLDQHGTQDPEFYIYQLKTVASEIAKLSLIQTTPKVKNRINCIEECIAQLQQENFLLRNPQEAKLQLMHLFEEADSIENQNKEYKTLLQNCEQQLLINQPLKKENIIFLQQLIHRLKVQKHMTHEKLVKHAERAQKLNQKRQDITAAIGRENPSLSNTLLSLVNELYTKGIENLNSGIVPLISTDSFAEIRKTLLENGVRRQKSQEFIESINAFTHELAYLKNACSQATQEVAYIGTHINELEKMASNFQQI